MLVMCTVLLGGIYLARESLTRCQGIAFIWLRRQQKYYFRQDPFTGLMMISGQVPRGGAS